MGKRRSSLALLLFLGIAALEGGCSRQDRECLSGIGRKLMERAGSATAGYREKLDGLKSSRSGTDSLQDKVNLRLRWEKVLADAAIEVVASGNEIELKGIVKNAEQRARATELAESTAGVDRVLVSLTVGEEKKEE
jgi:osmotically-inducible protein OsmY